MSLRYMLYISNHVGDHDFIQTIFIKYSCYNVFKDNRIKSLITVNDDTIKRLILSVEH